MKLSAFALRNLREMLRDKLNLAFGIGFPLVILLLLTLIQSNVPVPLFAIGSLTPGIAVFGLSFVSLFSAQLIAKDRSSALMLRLRTSPMSAWEFILGYTLPLLPMAMLQTIVCLIAAAVLGLPVSVNMLFLLAALLPAAPLFIGIGLLCGTLLTDKQVGGICGALLTNLSAWLSGTWFDLSLVGGAFERIAMCLPFARAVEAGRAALAGKGAAVFENLIWVLGYGVLVMALAVVCFTRKMRSDEI